MRLSFLHQTSSPGDLLPEFNAPPVVETSIGIQFDGLDAYRSLFAADFWQRIKKQFPVIEEHAPLDPQFETFGPSNNQLAQPNIQLVQGAILPRYFFINQGNDELIQLQSDRLFFNWRKRQQEASYPRYTRARQQLAEHLKILCLWAREQELGEIVPTQCEALYVNRIALRDGRGNGCGLSFFFPWLKGLKGTTESGTFQFNHQLNDEKGEPVARLHSTLRYGTDLENNREAQLLLHVRGRPVTPSIEDCLTMIDAEREVIVRSFAEITSEDAHALWERKQ